MNKKHYNSPAVEQFAALYLADICQTSQIPGDPQYPGGTPPQTPETAPAFRRLL